MTFDLPLPPSANDYWVIGWHRRKPCLVLSKEARAYKTAIALKGRVEKREPLEGPVELRLVVHFADGRSDLSNRIKVLEDALQGVAYLNDRQVVRLVAESGERAFPPRVEVEVLPCLTLGARVALETSKAPRRGTTSSPSASAAARSSRAPTAAFVSPPPASSFDSTRTKKQS